MSETPAIDDFLSDPAFRATVSARQEMIMIQGLAKEEVSLPDVTTEIGARILACYALGDHVEVSEPGRFAGKHDMGGGLVFFQNDPLFRNKEVLLEAFTLIRRIRDAVKGPITDLGLFIEDDMMLDEPFVLSLLAIDGSFWICLPDDMQRQPAVILQAVRTNPHILSHVSQKFSDDVTEEAAETAVRLSGPAIQYVPPRLLTDDLFSMAIDAPNGSGAYLPLFSHVMEQINGVPLERTWGNRERTLKAIRQSPGILKSAPGWCLLDDECIGIAVETVRTDAIRMRDFPPLLQSDDRLAAAFAESLPRRRNAYGWIDARARSHPIIVEAVLKLLPDEQLRIWLPEDVRKRLES